MVTVPRYRMKRVSCVGAKPPTACECVISSRLASHVLVVSAVLDGTHLNTSQLVLQSTVKRYT